MDPNETQQPEVGPSSGAPLVPPELGGDPTQGSPVSPQGGQPVTPEQKQTLLDLIGKIREKLHSLHAVKFATSNKTEALRRALLTQVFQKLQLSGVDLTSRESVANFITKLQQSSPELAANFEKAMDALLGGPQGGAFATPTDPNAQIDLGVPPQSNMNNQNPNEAPAQTVPPVGQQG